MKLENRFTVPVPREQAWRVLLDVERIAPCMPGAKLLTHDGDSFTGQVKVKIGPINLTYGGTASFLSLDEQAGVAVIEGSGKETRGTGTAKATITCRLLDQGGSTDIEVDTDLAVTGKPASFGRGVLADVSAKLVDQFAACLAQEIRDGGVDGTATDTADAADTVGTAGTTGTDAGTDAGTPTGTEIGAVAAPTEPDAALSGAAAQQAEAEDAPDQAGGTGPARHAPEQAAAPGTATAARAPRPEAEPIDLVGTAGLPVLKRAVPLLAGLAGLTALAVVLLRRRR